MRVGGVAERNNVAKAPIFGEIPSITTDAPVGGLFAHFMLRGMNE
jgi:hypothetical protein